MTLTYLRDILDYADNWTPPVKAVAAVSAEEDTADPSDYVLVIWISLILLIIGIITLSHQTLTERCL